MGSKPLADSPGKKHSRGLLESLLLSAPSHMNPNCPQGQKKCASSLSKVTLSLAAGTLNLAGDAGGEAIGGAFTVIAAAPDKASATTSEVNRTCGVHKPPQDHSISLAGDLMA
eukprot:TRINITY_DN775_c0_g1_i4.p3 TRINITY_DN775_c0_g1~~TRINITY_DN775_c0_g1_i4.p3  ORF type:complete len:113 (+),score=6.90 TRINITY_DN775_c0_g1_i4:1679-2017(+)